MRLELGACRAASLPGPPLPGKLLTMTSPRALAFVVILICSFVTTRGHAEDAALRLRERSVPARAQLKLAGAALGGALLGAALTGAVGATTYALADCGACDGEDEDLTRGIQTLVATSLS